MTPDDLEDGCLPQRLRPFHDRLFSLTINAERLAHIRSERRPNSRYASQQQCRWELERAERLFKRERIPMLDTTHTSVEEISGKVLEGLHIERRLL